MTARIARSFSFTACVHFNNQFYTNFYDIDLNFVVESDVIHEQNIAMERIKYFIAECMDSALFINQSYTEAIEKYMEAGIRVCTLPEEPYDQIIGIMLLTKLNSITEGRLTVTDISTTSTMSDSVSCQHSIEESTGPFLLKGWWNNSLPDITDVKQKNKKVVKLKKTKNDWDELSLGYKKKDIEENDQTIVFVSFEPKTEQ